jgi:hypothetical protein
MKKTTKIQEKILNAINKGSLNPVDGKRKWYSYILSIQNLFWERNNFDGFIVDVYDKDEIYIDRVVIEIRSVVEFGCVHNKCFLS